MEQLLNELLAYSRVGMGEAKETQRIYGCWSANVWVCLTFPPKRTFWSNPRFPSYRRIEGR